MAHSSVSVPNPRRENVKIPSVLLGAKYTVIVIRLLGILRWSTTWLALQESNASRGDMSQGSVVIVHGFTFPAFHDGVALVYDVSSHMEPYGDSAEIMKMIWKSGLGV